MVILHGEDLSKSRARLNELRLLAQKEGKEIVVLEGKNVELTDLIQSLEASSLFGNDRLVIVEGLFSSAPSKRRDELISYLSKNNSEMVVMWESKKAPALTLKKLNGKVEEFKVAATIFNFVESLTPGNTKSILINYDKALEQDAAELVFFMVLRQVRQLIQVISDPGSFKGPVWLSGKLLKQARAFGLEKLLDMHAWLYEIDKAIKTGKTGLDLKTELELWIVGL